MKVDLIVRFFNEHVYADHFIDYYLRLGFDHIHILFQSDQKPYNIQNSKVSIVRHPYFGNDVFTNLTSLVNTSADWIFMCDADEYLYLKNFKTIKEFANTIPSNVEQVFFQWAMIENFADMSGKQDMFEVLTTHAIYTNPYIKSMISLSNFKFNKINNHFSFASSKSYLWGKYVNTEAKCSLNIEEYKSTYPFIIHFHTRSLKNAFIKGLTTHFTLSGKKIDCNKFMKMIATCNINEIVQLTKLCLPFVHSKNPILQMKIQLTGSLINYDDEDTQLRDICATTGINYEELLEVIHLLDKTHSSHFRLHE